MSQRKSCGVKTNSFCILHHFEILTQSERSAAAFVNPSTIERGQKAIHRVLEVIETASRTKIPKVFKCERCQVAFSLTQHRC
jgi:hypothetical protein